jgi:hypothetical protein
MENGVMFDILLAANIVTCQPVDAVSSKESNFIMLPGKTVTPPSKIEYPPLKTLSPGSQKASAETNVLAAVAKPVVPFT